MTMLFETNWRAGMGDVSAAIDDTMGECVTVIPVTVPAVNFPGIPDRSRAVTVMAVFTRQAKTLIMGENHGRTRGGVSVSPLISTSEPVVSFSYGVLPFPILQGYQIERCNGELFEVTDVKPDGVARIVCPVNQLGRELEAD
jgi:hypothetical protein